MSKLNRHPSALNVIPDCYSECDADEKGLGRGFSACPKCPYRSKCTEPSAQPILIPEEEVEEPDGVFEARLKVKMKERYND